MTTENKKTHHEEKVEEELKPVETSETKDKSEEKIEKSNQKKEIKVVKKDLPKKTEAMVNGYSLHMSTKTAMAICRYIRRKEIRKAIQDLEEVTKLRKAVPMKGEIPHRKGIGPGRYPVRASKIFLNLLKNLAANSDVNKLDNPVIFESVANIASRPYGKFGSVRSKRTHIKLVAKEKVGAKK